MARKHNVSEEREYVPLSVNERFFLYGREWKVKEVRIDEIRRDAYTGFPKMEITVEAVYDGRIQIQPKRLDE